jgi:hypothetical protein
MKRDAMDTGAGSDDPKRFRQPSSSHDGHLNLSANAWLKELPPDVVPVALANRYPRIVNRLSRFWDSPKMISECFRELLVHRRSGRDGFPEDVLLELFALDQYYHETHKTPETDTWASTPPRRP